MKAMSNELKAISVFSLYSLLIAHCLLLRAFLQLEYS